MMKAEGVLTSGLSVVFLIEAKEAHVDIHIEYKGQPTENDKVEARAIADRASERIGFYASDGDWEPENANDLPL